MLPARPGKVQWTSPECLKEKRGGETHLPAGIKTRRWGAAKAADAQPSGASEGTGRRRLSGRGGAGILRPEPRRARGGGSGAPRLPAAPLLAPAPAEGAAAGKAQTQPAAGTGEGRKSFLSAAWRTGGGGVAGVLRAAVCGREEGSRRLNPRDV